jgi:hypothetical protein
LPAAPPKSSEGCDAVLIDDDPLVRRNWELSAAKAGVRIKTFSSAAEFMISAADLDRSTAVYVDSWLGNEEHGVEESKRIFDMGFRDIYLATGDVRAGAGASGHLKGTIGKTPPWGTTA